jgi:hypothetical protein
MKATFGLCLLALLVPQQQCSLSNLTSPDSIKQRVESSLQPYFPNAKAEVLPSQGIILGFTCMYGAGPDFLPKIASAIASDKDTLRALSYLPYLSLVGVNYRYFAIGFDNGLLRYDVQSKQFATIAPFQGYTEIYRSKCGVPQSSDGPYVYIGRFQVTFTNADGTQGQRVEGDPLGLYASDDRFEQNQQDEIDACSDRIKKRYAKSGTTVTAITLIGTRKVSAAR